MWEKIDFNNFSIEASFFHILISAIRYQLQLGYKIISLIQSSKANDLSSYFPKIYPRALLKKQEIAKQRGAVFYKKALKTLFEIDLISKTQNSNFSYLLDLLKTKLIYLSNDANIIA